jgi:hypothetical protein
LGAKVVKRGQIARRSDFENRAMTGFTASNGCPVEIPVRGLDQARLGGISIWAAGLGAKFVKGRDLTAGCYLEYGAAVALQSAPDPAPPSTVVP